MTEAAPAQPLKWSEIHSIAKQELGALEEQIRIEINASPIPLPQSGGARHQFFVLLEEQANDWAVRARNAYEDCLKAIGRENAPGANHAIWCHGFSFFIRENIRGLMLSACGIGSRERRLLAFQSSGKYPTPSEVIAVRVTARDIGRIVDRISKHWETDAPQVSETWLEATNRLLAELKGHVPTPQNPLIAQRPLTAIRAVKQQENREEPGEASKADRKAAILKRIQKATPAGWITTDEAAFVFDVNPRTILNWVEEGKLDKGVKRGTITAASTNRLLARQQ